MKTPTRVMDMAYSLEKDNLPYKLALRKERINKKDLEGSDLLQCLHILVYVPVKKLMSYIWLFS